MSILSRDDYEFLEIIVGGESLPPSPMEIITPEDIDPFWEISYREGIAIFATGNVVIKAQLKKELEVIGGTELAGGRTRRKVISPIDRVKENEGDAV